MEALVVLAPSETGATTMKSEKGLASPSRPQRLTQEIKANQCGCAGAGSLCDTLCFNYLPPRASDPFEVFCISRGIPCFICQQLRLLRGRTLGTAKNQQTQLGCANTAYGFVLASLPTPIPDSPSGAAGGGGARGGEKGGGGGIGTEQTSSPASCLHSRWT